MTNIFNHHSHRSVFLQPAHPDQQSSTAMRTRAGKRVEAPAFAFPRALPLDAARGIPRETARQDASHTPQSTQAYSTPSLSLQKGSIRPLHKGEAAPPEQSVTTGISVPRPQTQRSLGGVRQDKDRSASDRVASRQPASVNADARSRATSRNSARSPKPPADNHRTVPVQVWVRPHVKAELSRLATQDGLSLSATGGALLERALQQTVDLQYGALLTPIIEDAIAKQMRGISTRLAWLLVRVAFDAGQTRSLVTNILGRQPGVSQDLLKTILAESGRSAKANITRRTPQIESLIEAVEQWITEGNSGGENNG